MKQQKTTPLLLRFLHGSKAYFAVSVIATLFMAAGEMLPSQVVRFAIDSVLIGEDVQNLWVERITASIGGTETLRHNLWILAAVIAAIAIVSALSRYLFRVYSTKASETLVETMRNTIFSHIQSLPYAWHMKNRTGDIIQRCTSDIDTVRNFLSEQMTHIARILSIILFSLYAMFSMHARLAAVAALSLPVIVAYSYFFHRQIGPVFERCEEKEGELSAIAQENLTGVRVVRAFGKEEYERERFETCDRAYTSLWLRACVKLSGFWSTSTFLCGLLVMAAIVLGAVACVKGTMTAGEYIAFVSYNTILVWPVRQLGRIISELSRARVAYGRIREICSAEVERDREGALTPDLTGDIVLEHVTFAYDQTPILDDLSLTIPSGKTLGILGATGSGKSTLVHLIDRLYDLGEGQGKICIGGVDIADMKAEHLRKHIGIVLQEPYLFSRTLKDNIAITQDEVDMDAVQNACRDACLDKTIEEFSKGYDTFVGERGVTLSGGQKQRAAIARLLMQPAPILILDDSLSAVDTETDAVIRKALKERLKNATVILISHRINTLMHADNIIVLENGKILESGSHEELIEKEGGVYARIHQMQSRKEDV